MKGVEVVWLSKDEPLTLEQARHMYLSSCHHAASEGRPQPSWERALAGWNAPPRPEDPFPSATVSSGKRRDGMKITRVALWRVRCQEGKVAIDWTPAPRKEQGVGGWYKVLFYPRGKDSPEVQVTIRVPSTRKPRILAAPIARQVEDAILSQGWHPLD